MAFVKDGPEEFLMTDLIQGWWRGDSWAFYLTKDAAVESKPDPESFHAHMSGKSGVSPKLLQEL